MGTLAHEALEALLHRIERTMNRRELTDRWAWRFDNLGRPPERVRRRHKLGKRRDEAPRGENRNGSDKQRADEYRSKRLRQPPARSSAARLNRQPTAIVEIHADQECRGQQQVFSRPKRSAE